MRFLFARSEGAGPDVARGDAADAEAQHEEAGDESGERNHRPQQPGQHVLHELCYTVCQ